MNKAQRLKVNLQAKDLHAFPVLVFLSQRRGFSFPPEISGECSIYHAFPPGTPLKLILEKMRSLIRRGLVEGCACGCRGEFQLTPLGWMQFMRLTSPGPRR